MTLANLGTFVLLATPHGRAGAPGNESVSKDRLRTAAGLLGALMGRNAVYEPVFDVEINAIGNTVGLRSPTIENPGAFRELILSESRLGVLELCASRMSSLPTRLKHRAELSLRWLYQAMRELDGVVAFLKYWIGIETLAMPDGTDIKPVNQHLAAAYNQSEGEARRVFAVGRLFGLRGQIVHHGRTPRINQYLLAYTEGIYVDVLVHMLDGKSNIALGTLKNSGRKAIELIDEAILSAQRET